MAVQYLQVEWHCIIHCRYVLVDWRIPEMTQSTARTWIRWCHSKLSLHNIASTSQEANLRFIIIELPPLHHPFFQSIPYININYMKRPCCFKISSLRWLCCSCLSSAQHGWRQHCKKRRRRRRPCLCRHHNLQNCHVVTCSHPFFLLLQLLPWHSSSRLLRRFQLRRPKRPRRYPTVSRTWSTRSVVDRNQNRVNW